MKIFSRRHVVVLSRMVLGVFVLSVFLTTTGCEPLRKKFTRKKKENQVSEAVPLMAPEEYPVASKTVAGLYRQEYAMLLMWLGEMKEAVEEKASNKKLNYCLARMISLMEEMQTMLQGQAQEKLLTHLKHVKALSTEVVEPEGFRNKSKMTRDLRELDKQIRKDLRPAAVAADMVAVLPPQL